MMHPTPSAARLVLVLLFAGLACAIETEDPVDDDPRSFGMCTDPNETLRPYNCSFKLATAKPSSNAHGSACYVWHQAAVGEGWDVRTKSAEDAYCSCSFASTGKKTCPDFAASNPIGSGSPTCKGTSKATDFGGVVYGGGVYEIGDPDFAANLALDECLTQANQRCDKACAKIDPVAIAGGGSTIECCGPVADEEEASSSSDEGGSQPDPSAASEPSETTGPVDEPEPVPAD